jgi:hypothetical protein
MTFILKFIKSGNCLKVDRRDRHTDRQEGDLLSVLFAFRKENWLKIKMAPF